jgi:hypothetical protein
MRQPTWKLESVRLVAVFTIAVTAFGVLAPAPARAAAAIPDKIDFNRDVRPIFTDTCFACHGPDKNSRKANLRLDTKEGAFAALKDGKGHVIVPGKTAESEVYRRVSTTDSDDLMPPPSFNKPLTERQVAILKKWIEQGAEYKGHWAYQPIQHAAPGATPDDAKDFVRNPIDVFVLAHLKEAELKHSPEADRVTLIRRLYFDLVGLPPTKEQVDAFVNDKSGNAYEKVVDQLLASPHYGERMAVFWLDLVRYADTIGYHSDNPMPVSPYRDYVINSFNQNTPFDRFTVEQLAGDLLPDANTKTRVASAYNRLLQTTEEGGAQPKEYVAKYAADRVRNVSTVWLGQTMGCAECHDHKFDPTTTRDFYSMEAFFADVEEPAVGKREAGMPVLSDEDQAKAKQLDGQIAELKKQIDATTPELVAAQAEWEKARRESAGQWKTIDFATLAAANGTMLSKQPDGSIKAGGTIPATETYTLTANVDLKGVTAFRLEALTDESLQQKGPGASPNGNFVLTEFKVAANGQPVKLQNAAADFSQDKWPVANAIDGKDNSGWAVMGAIGASHVATFEAAAPVAKDATGPVTLTFTLEHKEKFGQHNLGRFRISAATVEKPSALQPLPVAVQAVIDVDPAKRTDAQKNELAAYYRGVAPSLKPKREELAKVEKSKNDLVAAAPKVLATEALKEPRTIRILPRGNWLDDSGPIVEPAVPAFLGKVDVSGRRANRLDLAQWLVRKDNPLTARVFMNRVWRMLLGRGITQPLDDLGLQGEMPANPELLDYLSADFMDHGWDVKRAIRNIVLSGTYRQTSKSTAEQREVDPFNKLCGRQGRFRLDAEFVRDNALAISGLLVDKIGGPSVKPYQPAGYWFALNFPPREWENDKGEGLYRRGLYTWWQRSFLHPSLLAFDAPTREECTAERPRSNIPQQALALLNDPTYVEAARVLAEKIVRQGGADPTARIQWAFGRALSREANSEELKVLTELFQKHSQTYSKDVDAATKLVSNGAESVPKDLNVSELAAWTSVARAILNLHETITRY